ncbi:hypothetical protein [Thalassoroseus pseudoceratinae]|uniref:hypothetical protein n=1 Tax=Thalassoroseus pseudoceratinae TaxID=2713176 RepID=UPI00141EC676|nr:hypothetical protein [Thalassoroseus pseudoceratinae]
MLDLEGNLLWTYNWDSSSDVLTRQKPISCVLDSARNVYVYWFDGARVASDRTVNPVYATDDLQAGGCFKLNKSGVLQWSVDFGTISPDFFHNDAIPPRMSLAYDEESVYVGSMCNTDGVFFHRLDCETGETIQTFGRDEGLIADDDSFGCGVAPLDDGSVWLVAAHELLPCLVAEDGSGAIFQFETWAIDNKPQIRQIVPNFGGVTPGFIGATAWNADSDCLSGIECTPPHGVQCDPCDGEHNPMLIRFTSNNPAEDEYNATWTICDPNLSGTANDVRFFQVHNVAQSGGYYVTGGNSELLMWDVDDFCNATGTGYNLHAFTTAGTYAWSTKAPIATREGSTYLPIPSVESIAGNEAYFAVGVGANSESNVILLQANNGNEVFAKQLSVYHAEEQEEHSTKVSVWGIAIK